MMLLLHKGKTREEYSFVLSKPKRFKKIIQYKVIYGFLEYDVDSDR